jgi:hypothetical protein
MSGKIMGEVFKLALTHAQRDVLLALADHADDNGGSVRPSHALIAWKLDCSERSVRRNVDELLRAGILKQVWHSGPGRPNEYRIDLSAGVRKAPFREENNGTVATAMAGVDNGTAATAMAGVDTEQRPFRAQQRPKTNGTAAISRATAATAVSTKPSYESSSLEPSIESSSSSATTDDDEVTSTLTWMASEYPRVQPGRKLNAAQLAELFLSVTRIPEGQRRSWCSAALAGMADKDLDSPFAWLRRVLTNAVVTGKAPGTNGNGKNGHDSGVVVALHDAAARKNYYAPAGYEGIVMR